MLEFEYTPLNAGGFNTLNLVYLPLLNITLKSNGSEFTALCLIDSGAEYCVLDAEIGEAMGLVVQEGRPISLSGVQDPRFTAYLHDIEYMLEGKRYPATVAFSYNTRMGHGILGRHDFFDYFKVCFDHRNGKFKLEPY